LSRKSSDLNSNKVGAERRQIFRALTLFSYDFNFPYQDKLVISI
jgi:hypothetical protein